MRHVREQEIVGERAPEPNSRTLKHLIAPWTTGSERLWVGVSEIDPGASSNLHARPNEEVFYVLSGHGSVEVAAEREQIAPGSAVLVPANTAHRLRNEGSEPLRVLSCASPAFEKEVFDDVHLLG